MSAESNYRRLAEIYTRLAGLMGAATAAYFRNEALKYSELADAEEARAAHRPVPCASPRPRASGTAATKANVPTLTS